MNLWVLGGVPKKQTLFLRFLALFFISYRNVLIAQSEICMRTPPPLKRCYMINNSPHNRYGRKRSTLLSLFLGGICSCIVAVIPATHHLKSLRTVIGIIGKFCCTVSFDAVYTWALETYPTHVRSTGMVYLTRFPKETGD